MARALHMLLATFLLCLGGVAAIRDLLTAQNLYRDLVGRDDDDVPPELKPMAGIFTSSKYEYAKVDGNMTILTYLKRAAELNPDKIALRQPFQDETGNLTKHTWEYMFKLNSHTYKYHKITWQEFHERVMNVAGSFLKLGLRPMDAVNIRGMNSPEWLIAFLGCIAAGGLPVGLYPTDSPAQLKFKAKDSAASFIVLGKTKDLKHYADFLPQDDFDSVKGVILWQMNKEHPTKAEPALVEKLGRKFYEWEDFEKMAFNDTELRRGVEESIAELKPGQAATVVYTSGTTGNPKGVMLSHDAMVFTCETLGKRFLTITPPGGETRILSYLPLNHIAGQMMDIIAPMYLSTRPGEYAIVYFSAYCFIKKTCFKEQLADTQPTTLLGVPAVWNGLKTKLEVMLEEKWLLRLLPKGLVLKALGLNKVVFAITGAGAIGRDTLSYFKDLFQLNILNMYAQSESCGLGTAWINSDYETFNFSEKAGAIGRAMGNEVKINNTGKGEGEILLKGRNVMLGYLNRPNKTSGTISEDGWLRTGDLAAKDDDGFVKLTGRIKDIMKDFGGEMIAPQAVEQGIESACNKPGASILKRAIAVGDGMNFLSVLLEVMEKTDQEGIPTGELLGAGKKVDPNATTIEKAKASPKWNSLLADCINEYNGVAAKRAERVYRYFILPKGFTPEDSPDCITPTFKIKRRGVNTKYEGDINSCGMAMKEEKPKEVKACGVPY